MKNQLLPLLIGLLVWVYSYAYSEDGTPTPPPSQMISLFEGDTCAPPCWFGLVPGESDRHDVIRTFTAIRHLLEKRDKGLTYRATVIHDRETYEPIGWQLGFHWEDYPFGGQSGSYIQLKHSRVYKMYIYVNQEIRLREFLVRFGYPDHIRFGLNDYSSTLMYLIYEDERLRVDMELPRFRLCSLENMADVFRVDRVRYYSSQAAWELITNSFNKNPRDPQPRLLYRGRRTHEIPLELFEQWLNNEETGLCLDIWNRLVEELNTD